MTDWRTPPQAFAPRALLECTIELAARHGMSSHELGDACLIIAA
ncbi:MAG TPA: hypothetical protein VM513_30265 [Kofleriaceae bacterium]|nr:hypothetical protein [Kofleriaceae bacterium]